ncbi:MAG: hypothetical protein IJW26_02015 [Clostridia bacterium]|nr:hypothetical protein [Clostridia bacterium]
MKKLIKNSVLSLSVLIFTLPSTAFNQGDEFVTVNANQTNVSSYLQSVSNGEIILDDAHYGELTLGVNKTACESEGDGNRTPYCGAWNIDSLTISGTKNAILDGFSIDIDSKNYSGVQYEPTYNINTLKIKGITMYGPIALGYHNLNKDKLNRQNIENLIIEDVTFDFSELASETNQPATGWKIESAIWFIPKKDNVKNLVIKNCTFTNMNDVRAVILLNAIREGYTNETNVTIEGCSFDSAGFNPIQVAGSAGHLGNYVIRGNTFTGSNNACVRMHGVRGNIEFSNNVFNAPNDNNYSIYVSSSEMAQITLSSDNVFNGTTISLNGEILNPIN